MLAIGTLWFLCFLSLFKGLDGLARELLSGVRSGWGLRRDLQQLRQAGFLFHEIQDALESGRVPGAARFEELRGLDAPWGTLASSCLLELRAQGAPVLPTLKRLRSLAEGHLRTLQEAKARASHALAQAGACGGLVPLFSLALHSILPGVSSHPWLWWGSSAVALGWAAVGAYWLICLADQARWAGLRPSERGWMLSAQCAGERFLATVRTGVPADLAWLKACEFLRQSCPELALHWGRAVGEASPAQTGREVLIEAGRRIRQAVHFSLMEGRPCTERVEAVLAALRGELEALTVKELSTLPTRALRPLFVCVAPALFGLLALGMFLAWQDSSSDWPGGMP